MRHFAPVLLVFACCTESCSAQQSPTADRTAEAKEFVSVLAKGDFGKAVDSFDSTMRKALPEAKLKDVWSGLIKQVGAFKQQTGARMDRISAYDVAFVTCEFEHAKLDAKVVYDKDGKITGLFFVPPTQVADSTPPAYAKPESYAESDVTFGVEPWILPATLSLPKGDGPFPALVLVHGSGPQDRDETVGANKPFRDLAMGLASRGVAVLRYEKRTKQHGAKLNPLPLPFTVKQETIDDATAAVEFLRGTSKIDLKRIFVLGHSLGGMLIPRIASDAIDAAGFIVLAGTTRQLEDVIIEQTNYIAMLDGDKSTEEQKTLDAIQTEVNRIKKLSEVDAKNPAIIFGAPASYWLDLRNYDPAESAKAISKPLLILQGERDYQVTMKDFERWKTALSARPNVTFKTYPGVNHLFIEGKGPSRPDEYNTPSHVAEPVIADISNWILAAK